MNLLRQETMKEPRKSFAQKDSMTSGFNLQKNNSQHNRNSSLENVARLSLGGTTSPYQKSIDSFNNINNQAVTENKQKVRDEIYLFGHPKPYLGGTLLHKMSFEEMQIQNQEKPSLQILDQQSLIFSNVNVDVNSLYLNNSNINCFLIKPKKKKIVQKEKSYTFDFVQGEDSNNQLFYKKTISPSIQKFVAGTNQSILVFGGEDSGKTQTLVGGMRDPGLYVLCLQEIFEILYASPDRENTTLKMSMYYNDNSYFYDLLVNHNFPHKLYEKENGEVFPFGISEVIVTSLRTSLKILKQIHLISHIIEQLRKNEFKFLIPNALIQQNQNQWFKKNIKSLEIGLDNIQKSESVKKQGNIVLSFKCERSENILISQDTILSTLKIIKTSDGSYEEMIDCGKDECMMINLMNCLRQLSKMSNKKKNTIIPFRKNIYTEYLRESLIGNSETSVICCLNTAQKRVNDTGHMLRLGNSCKKILTNQKEVKNSISHLTNLYKDILENIGNTIQIWLKEFWGELDKVKQKRIKIIMKILNYFQKSMLTLLDVQEQQVQIDLIKNALFAKILDMHCKIYSQSITSEDIKEFFLAKIQIYAQKELQEQFEQLYPTIHFVLQQLEENKDKIIKTKAKLSNFFKQYIEAKKVSLNNNPQSKEQATLIPTEIKIAPQILLNANSLSNLDIEKMGFLQKLFSKFSESCENIIECNQYIPQNVRSDVLEALKDFKFLEKVLQEDGIYQEENSVIGSRLSLRKNPSVYKNSKVRGSFFKQQRENFSHSRMNSQLSEPSFVRQNTSQIDQNQSIRKLEQQQSQIQNETLSEDSRIEQLQQNDDQNDEQDQQIQSDYYLNDKSRIKGQNSSQNDIQYFQDKIDARKIKELQIKLNIIPQSKNIFVNNTKLSFQKTDEMSLTTKANFKIKIPPKNTSVNASINSQISQTERQYGQNQSSRQDKTINFQNLGLSQTKSNMLNGPSIKNMIIKPITNQEQSNNQPNQSTNDSKLIENVFRSSTKHNSLYSNCKSPTNIFLTQQIKDNRNLFLNTPQSERNTLTKRSSITSLNLNSQETPSMRRFPQMMNTVYSFKLPTLTESIRKGSIQKFMYQ